MRLGIDIGGSYLRYELREGDVIVAKDILKSTEIGLSSFLDAFLQKNSTVTTVCIAYAGQVRNGTILSAPHIDVDRHELKAYIESRYRVALFLENDLNCAVLAEAAFFGSNDICAMYLGTGLGLGVISASHLLQGAGHIAAELGHVPFKKAPFVCSCGKDNCVELFCSGGGLLRWKQEKKIDTALSLSQLKSSSDTNAQDIYHEFFEALYHSAGIVVTLFNPKILVLGGGLLNDEAETVTKIQKKITEYALPLSTKELKIVTTQLKDAPLQGAFLLKDNDV